MGTNAAMLFGKNKVFIVDYFTDLAPFGEENNLYVVRFAADGTTDNKMYEWKNNQYAAFSFGAGSGAPPTTETHEASIEVYDERKDLPDPKSEDAKANVLYVVLMDITAERKTTMYLLVNGEYLLLAAFSAGGSIQEYTQITKLGVVASASVPRTYEITIPRTTDFLRAPIEVLKFTLGSSGVNVTQMSFTNADATDFKSNDDITFDGVMQLNKAPTLKVMDIDSDWDGKGSLHRKKITREDWVRIGKLEVEFNEWL